MFKIIKIIILLFLCSNILYPNKIEITEKGIINLENNNIINKYITTIPMTYLYYIEKNTYNTYVLRKETLLHSSKEQCYIPLYKKNNGYKIHNIYCYDIAFTQKKELPIFYMYNLSGIDINKFDPEALSHEKVTFGRIKNKKIIFSGITIYSVKEKKYYESNLNCTIPGNSFYDSEFDKFQCNFKNINSMHEVSEKLKSNRFLLLIDINLLSSFSIKFPLSVKNLTPYNNIAYHLQKAGANKEAIYLLEKIIEKFPDRTVAYYNIGDAYWELGEKQKAIEAYTTYVKQMHEKGLQKKIPKEILRRVKNK